MERNNSFLKSLFFVFIFHIKYINCYTTSYFNSFRSGNITKNANMIDITDYHKLYLLITTEKKIYTGITPVQISTTNSNIIKISAVATYDTNYIILACSENYLLSKIKIETGEEEPLLTYNKFNLDITNLNYLCSISVLDNIFYIGISQVISNSLQNNIIKAELVNNIDNNGTNTINEKIYSFNYQLTNLDKIIYKRQISCEIIEPINELNNPRLVCGYIKYENSIYIYFASVMNSQFNDIEHELQIIKSKSLLSFRLQKINSTYIKYIVTANSYEIYLNNEDSKYQIILIKDTESNLYSFFCMNDLFYYYNNHIFSSRAVDTNNVDNFYLYTKKDTSANVIRYTEITKRYMEKVMGYYDEINDKYVFYYQYSTTIAYITIDNMDFLFHFKCQPKIAEVISNTISKFNVTELITYPLKHEPLSLTHSFLYKTTETRVSNKSYATLDETNQILTVNSKNNEWLLYYLYFTGGKKTSASINTIFTLSDCTVNVRTCAFGCGSCSKNFSICDEGKCKAKFAMLKDSGDINCYPNDQNMPNYIYDEDTDYYEKCYSSCKFCSIKSSLSSNIEHNCLTCKEGYLKSYRNMGNCYKIDYPLNESNTLTIYKNISCKEDESYTVVDSCVNNYIIAETGECVPECPTTTIFNSFVFNSNIDFSKQSYDEVLGLQYILNLEDIPKYLFGNLCYQKCPNFTSTDDDNNLCKCLYGWEQNSTTKEITCYNNKDYCLSKDYYYHNDTKECFLGGCRNGYYQFNFECFTNNCPESTSETNLNSFKCESDLNYCYIDEYYKTHCNDIPISEYYFKYKDTKIYLKNCNESLLVFGIKTYLYRNICYEICPENTYNDDIKDICSCNYYKNYLNKEKTDYECLSENEKCANKNKISVVDIKECIDNLEECINKDYKIFNEECYYNNCPENTSPKLDNTSICTCQYYYYKQSNIKLICYNSYQDCEYLNYSFQNFNSKECFQTKEECFERNLYVFENLCYNECPFGTEINNSIYDNSKECVLSKYNCTNKGSKYFNKICYEDSCPSNTIEKYNDGICICNSYYFNDSDILDCFEEGITCETHSPSYPYINIDTNECFNSLDECKNRDLKIFNDNCYNNCPENTELKNSDNSICICSNYLIIDNNNKLICFNSNETCETKGYSYMNTEMKECFNTKEDCINRGYDDNECFLINNVDETDSDSNTQVTDSNSDTQETDYDTQETDSNTYTQVTDSTAAIQETDSNTYTQVTDSTADIQETDSNTETQVTDSTDDIQETDSNFVTEETDYNFDTQETGSNDTQDTNSNIITQNEVFISDTHNIDAHATDSNYIKQDTDINSDKQETKDSNSDTTKICKSLDYIKNSCKINNNSTKYKDEIITSISNAILSGELNPLLLNITQNKEDILIKEDNIIFSITSTDNQNNKEYYNVSTIKLGQCEEELRSYYNISDNETLLMFKVDYFEEGILIPIIYYEVYCFGMKKKLNMSICKDIKIDVLLPASINENKLFLYNSSSEYYNDKCYKYTSDKGTDILLDDRKNEYIINNMSLCEKDCDYNGYNTTNKKALCKCNVKLTLSNYTEMSTSIKDKLMYKFMDIKSIANLDNLKCYRLLFEKDGLKNNIGSYIILSIIAICSICLFFFLFKGYNLLLNRISHIIKKKLFTKKHKHNSIKEKRQLKINKKHRDKIIYEPTKHKNKNSKSRSKTKHKTNINILIKNNQLLINKNINLSSGLKNRKSSRNLNKKISLSKKNVSLSKKSVSLSKASVLSNIKINNDLLNKNIQNKIKNDSIKKNSSKTNKNDNNCIKYNDYVMNSLSYKEAILIDKRTYTQYYLSLLRAKHLVIFTFYTYDDYNSKTIKIASFFFYIGLYFTVDALFFDAGTMHQIYEDEGVFNILFRLPKIIYSCLISSTITFLIRFFSVTESNVILLIRDEIKRDKLAKLGKILKIKFIIFFSLCFIFLIFFWYYLATFCALYQNSQVYLIKDALISFALSLSYPLLINLIPGMFRIPSLKNKNKECIYKFSQYVQLF